MHSSFSGIKLLNRFFLALLELSVLFWDSCICLYLLISQNYGIVQAGWDFWRSHSAAPTAESRVSWGRLSRTVSLQVWNISKDGETLWPFRATSSTFTKKLFRMFKWNFLYCNLCPLLVVHSVDTTGGDWFCSFVVTRPAFIHIRESPLQWNLPFSRLNRCLSLCLYDQCSNLQIIFVTFSLAWSSLSPSLLYWGGRNWSQHSRYVLTLCSHYI